MQVLNLIFKALSEIRAGHLRCLFSSQNCAICAANIFAKVTLFLIQGLRNNPKQSEDSKDSDLVCSYIINSYHYNPFCWM